MKVRTKHFNYPPYIKLRYLALKRLKNCTFATLLIKKPIGSFVKTVSD